MLFIKGLLTLVVNVPIDTVFTFDVNVDVEVRCERTRPEAGHTAGVTDTQMNVPAATLARNVKT